MEPNKPSSHHEGTPPDFAGIPTQSLLDGMSAHVAILDAEGRVIAVNATWRNFAQKNGYLHADLGVGCDYLQICQEAVGIDSREAGEVADGIMGVLSGQLESFQSEYPCHSPDVKRWYRILVNPLPVGNKTGALVLHVDITERYLAHEKLGEKAREFELLFDKNPLPMFLFDATTLKFLQVNEAAISHYGYSRDEFLSMTIEEIRPPEDIDKLHVTLANKLEGVTNVGVWRHKVKDGRIIHVEVTVHMVEFQGRTAKLVALADVTDRLMSEKILREREELLSSAQRIGNMGAWKSDLRAGRLEWPPETFELFGVKEEDFTGTVDFFLKMVHPEDLELLHQAYTKADGFQSVAEVHYRVIRPDGEMRWMFERGTVEFDDAGTPIRRLGMVMDMTEIIQAEQARAESEERFRNLLRDIPNVPIQGFDRHGTVIYWNKASEALYGYTEGEALGSNLFDLIIPEDLREDIQCDIDGFFQQNRQVPPGEFLLKRKDGSRVPVFTSFSLLKVPGEKPIMYCLDVDLTRQLELAREVAINEERFRLVAKATVDYVWDWDLITDYIWWSENFYTHFGYTRETLEPDARSWASRIHPDEEKKVLVGIHDVIDGREEIWESKYRFRKADGSYIWVVDRGFAIRNSSGKAIRMVGGMTDITEHVKLEEQLRKSQRLESVGQLTGGIAHDFNNLLTVIQGNSDLLLESIGKDDPIRPQLEMIMMASKRGADLTHRLLAFARRQTLDPRIVDVNELINGMEPLLRRTLGEDIEIRIVKSSKPWKAMIDPVQLESALLNLTLNSRDAMEGGGMLTIETTTFEVDEEYCTLNPDARPGNYVIVAVSDTGSGISPDLVEKVFEPFYTTKKEGKGSGLGLSMVYGFVKQSQGHIKVYSEIGVGTTIRMYLPMATGIAEHTPIPRRDDVSLKGTETILLVEDDELVRQFAERQLQSFGYNVVSASNGPAALEIIRVREDLDLLFTDVVMPGGMNGRDLAIEALKVRPALKVLFTSGYADNVIVHHGKLEPGAFLLSKPYSRIEMGRKLREVLGSDET